MFLKISKYSQENTGKHLRQRPATLLKADSNACVFRVSVVKFLRKPILQNTTQKMKFSIKDFFSKCDQICNFLRIWSHLLKKFLMENLIFCALSPPVGASDFYNFFMAY